MNIYDVYPSELIENVAAKLKADYSQINPPEGSMFWKTSFVKEIAPVDHENFWYVRSASLLRKLYEKPIGVNRLRKRYGAKQKNIGHKKHKKKGSKAIIRRCLQQLETANLVKKTKAGRRLTPKGESLLDSTAAEILKAQSQ